MSARPGPASGQLRVGVIADRLQARRSGIGRYVREIVELAIAAEDVDPYLAVTPAGAAEAIRMGVSPDHLWILRSGPRALVALQVMFGGPAWFRQLDVVHALKHFVPVRPGPPMVLTVYDLEPLHPEGPSLLRRIALPVGFRLALRRASLVVAITPSVATRLTHLRPAIRRKLAVLPPSLPSALQDSVAEPLVELRGRRFLLHVSDLAARKNMGRLLRMWPEVHASTQTTLVLVGARRDSSRDLDEIAQLQAAGQLLELGPVSEGVLRWLYEHAQAMVFPSLDEGFGYPVLEAAALGCPVLTTQVPAVDRVPHGAVIQVLPPHDSVAWRDALMRAASSKPSDRSSASPLDLRAARPDLASVYRSASAPSRERDLSVVYFDHTAELGGGEIALGRLVRHLSSVESTVVLGAEGPFRDLLEDHGVRTEVLALDQRMSTVRRNQLVGPLRAARVLWEFTTAVFRLRSYLRRRGSDILHTNSLKANLIGGLAGRLARVPVVWHVRDRIAADYLPRPVVFGVRLAARLLPRRIIVDTAAVAATLPGREVAIIPSPIEALPPGPPQRETDELVVTMVGRVSPWKGQDVFLRAADRAFGSRDDVRCRIVGGPLFGEEDFLDELVTTAASLRLPHVEFLGHRDDVEALLAETDILVHASRIPEPFGLVIVEGLASGTAVVATSAGGPSEVITDGADGLLVPPGDADALAAALAQLDADPALRRRLGDGGRVTAAAYLPQHSAELVSELYRTLL